MRLINQNPSTKATAASGTVTFTSSDFDAAGLVAALFLFTGAGMTVGDLTRIRVKNAGITTHDMSLAQFQAWYQLYYGIAPVAADTAFILPFYLPTDRLHGEPGVDQAVGELLRGSTDEQDICQILRGSNPSIELVIGAGGAAGTVQMAWIKSTAIPRFYPVHLGNVLAIAASSANAHYSITEPGLIKGYTLPTTGLTRGKLTLGGIDRSNIEGVTLMAESQQQRNAQVVTDPIAVDIGGATNAPQGSSYFELETAAGWAGAANEGSIFALRPQ